MGMLNALTNRAIRGMFYHRLEEAGTASWASLIGNMFTSDQPSETYSFAGMSPALTAWRGSRRRIEPKPFSTTIVNDKFEASIGINKDDLRRDKTGQVRIRINELATRAAQLPQKVFTTLLEGNGNAYDGAAYFSDRSASTVSRVNNAQTDSSIVDPLNVTTAEMSKVIMKAISIIMSAKDDQGEPLNEFARKFCVMVPTLYWTATVGALRDVFTSASGANTLVSVAAQGIEIVPVLNSRLTVPTSTGVFYVFRTDSEAKPLIWQDEVEADLTSLEDGSDHAFFNNEYVYGVERIGNGGLGMPEHACRMTVS